MDIESLLMSVPWLCAALWVVVYSSDYLLTIVNSKASALGVADHLGREGSFELNPRFAPDVDAGRWVSPRFIRMLVFTTVLMTALCLVGGSSAAEPIIRNSCLFVIGSFYFPEFDVIARHVSNLATLRRYAAHEGVTGKLSHRRWLVYETSSVAHLGVAGLLLVCALVAWKASLFGGAYGVATAGFRDLDMSAVERAKADGRPIGRRVGRLGRLAAGVLVLAVATAGYLSAFSSSPPWPPAGTIWFGTGYNNDLLNVPILVERATSFPQGTSLIYVARFDKPSSGDDVYLVVDGQTIDLGIGPGPGTWNLQGGIPQLRVGQHIVSLEEGGGQVLATGTVTITPVPAAAPPTLTR